MTMCKRGILLCNLFILMLVVADENVQDIKIQSPMIDPHTEEESHQIIETNVPIITQTEENILETTLTKSPTEKSETLSFTQTHIFHGTEPSTAVADPHSDSLIMQNMKIKVQKCCPPHQVLKLEQYGSECVDKEENFDFVIFYANATHYWNYTRSSSSNVNVIVRNPCTEKKYYLDPESDRNDTFHVLFNTSLYIPYTMDMLTVDDYCLDIIDTSSTVILSALICTPAPKTEIFHYLYGAGFIVSVICLTLLAVYSMWRTDIDNDHKKCLAYFAGSMAFFFFFISISTFCGKYFPHTLNILIAYILFYLNLKYFIWLSILCYDTRRCVQLATDNQINRESFIKRYTLIAFITPLVFIVINLIDKCNPAIPNLYLEFSYSSSFLWVLFLFYMPTLISACVNIYFMSSIVLPKGSCKTVKEFIEYMSTEKWKPAPAPEKISQLKNMYRRTCFLCLLLIIFLVIDLGIFFVPDYGQQKPHFMFRSVIYCLQGFFVSSIFIRKKCCERPTKEHNTTVEPETILLNDV